MAMVNSTTVDEDDVSERVVKDLVEQLGELPKYFTTELILTVIVKPLAAHDFSEDPVYVKKV